MMKPDIKMTVKWDAQLRKGTLEIVVLASLKGRNLYGLELLQMLHKFETMKITEGTLYPLLDRLRREGLVSAEWQQEGSSKPRKYYQLTQQGSGKLTALVNRWRRSTKDVELLIENPGPEKIDMEGN